MIDLDAMIRWEEGCLPPEETNELFAGLIASGLAWTLQGCYGRMARDLIEGGWVTPDGVSCYVDEVNRREAEIADE